MKKSEISPFLIQFAFLLLPNMTNGAESAELWLREAGEGLLRARPPSGRTQTGKKILNCSHRFI
jgi:hypothetical protein